MSRSNLYFFAAAMFLIAAMAWGLSGQTVGFAAIAIAIAAVMLVLGVRERGRAG